MATDLAIKSIMYKYALKEGVKYIFRGNDFRSEGKQPRPWTYGDGKQMKFIHKKYGRLKRLTSFPFLPYRKILYAGFLRGIKDVRPYYYLSYTKEEAKVFLEEQFGWQYYGGHHHENSFTKYAMAIWLPDKFGIDKRVINLSAQIMAGSISKDAALNEISKPALDFETKKQLISYIIKKLDLTQFEYDKIWYAPNKSYLEYPNYEKLLFAILKYFKPFIKIVYKQMPMTFVEMEMNSKQNE
jgi:hypothetical protein